MYLHCREGKDYLPFPAVRIQLNYCLDWRYDMITKIELLLSNTDCMELTTDKISLFEINGIDVLKQNIPENIFSLKICFKLDFKNMAYHKNLGWGPEDYRYLYESKRYNLALIYIHYSDGSTKDFAHFPWEDEDRIGISNALETLTRLPDGRVQIEIHE